MSGGFTNCLDTLFIALCHDGMTAVLGSLGDQPAVHARVEPWEDLKAAERRLVSVSSEQSSEKPLLQHAVPSSASTS